MGTAAGIDEDDLIADQPDALEIDMNAYAAYTISTMKIAKFQSEAEHDRLARELTRDRQSTLRRIAARIDRLFSVSPERANAFPELAVPKLSGYPYRS
ncbi:MAG TPA: hypothetical protein VIV06_05490 [Candidatus Limnocylindrales bacterium]